MIEAFNSDLKEFMNKWGLKFVDSKDYEPELNIFANESVVVQVKTRLM